MLFLLFEYGSKYANVVAEFQEFSIIALDDGFVFYKIFLIENRIQENSKNNFRMTDMCGFQTVFRSNFFKDQLDLSYFAEHYQRT